MTERPILFSGPMVTAILEGRKTQTRRVVKQAISLVYGIADDLLTVYHRENDTHEWSYSETDPGIAERRLHGRGRWTDLLTNEIRGLWQKGIRGLVLAEGTPNKKGLHECFFVPREYQGNQECSSLGVHGVSRDAADRNNSGEASRRESRKQYASEPTVGHPGGELAGQESSRKDLGQSNLQIHARGETAPALGDSGWSLQSTGSSTRPGGISKLNFKPAPFSVGQHLWVRERFSLHIQPQHAQAHTRGKEFCVFPDGGQTFSWCDEYDPGLTEYDPGAFDSCRWRPSIFMPRWASRITLELADVRVERVQDISEEDAKAEGVDSWSDSANPAKWKYHCLWDSINGKKYPWSSNPWVWVLTFTRVTQ